MTDEFVLKKDVIELINITWKIVSVCDMKNKSETYSYLMRELDKLRRRI